MFKITTPNTAYCGRFADIEITDGVGYTSDASVAAAAGRLGYTVNEETPADSKPSRAVTGPRKANGPIGFEPSPDAAPLGAAFTVNEATLAVAPVKAAPKPRARKA